MAFVLKLLCLCSSAGLLTAKDAAVVFVVDPRWDCVESYVANVPLLQEYKIVKVMTNRGRSTWCNSDRADIYRNITFNSSTANNSLAAVEICPKLRSMGVPIAAVIPTFDSAGTLADRLAACVGVRGNSLDGPVAKARIDKWFMSEAVRKAGLRSIKEKLVTTWDGAKRYLESLSPPLSHNNPVIFKILEASSSEGVSKVYSLEQAEEVFRSEVGSKSSFGHKIRKILIQECLKGKEYVVDSVSRDGVHKVSMVWNEDLRPGNGVFNLYYGFKVMDPEDQKIKAIIDYSNKVLDATGVRNGASDMELFWLEEEGAPCVIDVNARWTALMWHDGLALEKALVGNDQITAAVNAYLDGDAFDAMPPVPSVKEHGAMVFPNVFHAGILRGIPGLTVAKKLPSYFGMSNYRASVGKRLEKFTKGASPIVIVLVHRDEATVNADYDRLIGLEMSGAFWDMSPSTANSSLTALRPGDSGMQGHRLLEVTALAALVVAVAFGAVAAMCRRDDRDGTEYLTIN